MQLLSAKQRLRFRKDPSAMLGLGIVTFLVLFAILGPFFTADPNASDFALARQHSGAPPGSSWEHLLGTDTLFRDALARLAHGARLSLTIAVSSVVLAVGIGGLIGVVAGYAADTRYRLVDAALMRIVDVALAFPYLLLITAIGVAVDRADATTVILILGLTSWTGLARLTRAKVLQVKSRDYVMAARALGAGPWRIVVRHILPAISPTLLIIATTAVAQMILAEAVLGYLTVGIEPPQATWGRMLQEAETYIGVAPLMVAAPGGLILLASLGFTRLGDGLREAIDPKNTIWAAKAGGRGRLLADLALLASVALAVALSSNQQLTGPAPAAAAEPETPRRGGILRLATMTPVPKLDPATAYEDGARAINDLIFARLVTYDTDGRVVPELAASYEVEEAKRFTFELRKGLTFHDGSPITAKDVKRSLERTLHPRSACPVGHLYRNLKGFAAYRKSPDKGLAGIQIEGEHTVVFELGTADVSFVSLLALGFAAPVCPSAGAFADRKKAIAPCGAGPFKVAELDLGRRVLLERFDGYYVEGKPYLDGVEWLQDVPARTQRSRFEQGELHIVTELTGIDSFRFRDDPRWAPYRHMVAKPVASYIFLNTQRAPFDNVHLRRAVAFAVDPSVLENVRANIGALDRVLPPAVPGPDRHEAMFEHDRGRALEEMERAGFPYDPVTGQGGYPHEIEYLTIPNTFEQAAAEIFQQQLARVGLRLRLNLVSFSAWLARISEPGRAQMGWRGWGADYPDASNFFAPTLTTKAITPTGTQNVSFYSNPRLDELIEASALISDHDARMQLFLEAERIVKHDVPLVPTHVSRAMHIVQPNVRGYVPHRILPLRVRDVWLVEDAP